MLAIFLPGAALVAEAPPAAEQIAAAVQAAPEDLRGGAKVVGWNAEGGNVVLREGSNELVCLAADPGSERWSVACYHRDLEPFMARGRALAAEGVAAQERQRRRFEEVEAGTLALPREPRTLYVLHGSGYDVGSDEVVDAYLRWVIYVPYATTESTGLTTEPRDSAPWLMAPGTAGAHIMINPPRNG
ncbi:MAG TPA: hypothetical protein VMV46_07230 [Thermoanaerobaculia bacterium]|nr:hypothetical protein [Thermoanaerobaculia bacterium]